MSGVVCELCQVPCVRGKCPECGRAAKGQDEPPRKNSVGNDNPTVPHRCAFKTGDWRCRWGKYDNRRTEFVLCPVHDEGLRRNITGTAEMFALLVELREYFQEKYDFTQFLDVKGIRAYKQGRLAAVDRPFFWKPIEVCWQGMTGLPLPVHAQVVEGQAALALKDQEAAVVSGQAVGGVARRTA